MIFEVDPSLPNPDDLKRDAAAAAAAAAEALYNESRSGPLTVLANSMCYLPLSCCMPADALSSLAARAADLSEFRPQDRAIRHGRFDPSAAKLGQIEYSFDLGNWNQFFVPPDGDVKKYATCLQILQYSFSKGHVYIRPGGAADKPVLEIDPRYYDGAGGHIDREIMTWCARTKPLADIIRARVFPPPSSAEAKGGDGFDDWIVNTTIIDWHPVGTCAMGGALGADGCVVDERLRVYGVRNLRVVDASVMPLQISAPCRQPCTPLPRRVRT